MDDDAFNSYWGSGGDPIRTDESFWPSFTDIMMVIVMIFIIASVVLIVRNWELVAELQATIEAERAARGQAESLSEAKMSLEERIAEEQRELELLRLQLGQAERETAREEALRRETEARLAALEEQMREMAEALRLATRQVGTLEGQLEQQQTRYAELESAQAESREALKQTEQQLTRSQRALAEAEALRQRQAAELAEARRQSSSVEERLASLQGDYDTLRYKYEELIKPARSASGKRVVEVRYNKEGDRPVYRIRPPGSDSARTVSRESLNRSLARLRQEYGDDLYVRVVIPSDSGLSYDEAWRFTREMLTEYDYYYR